MEQPDPDPNLDSSGDRRPRREDRAVPRSGPGAGPAGQGSPDLGDLSRRVVADLGGDRAAAGRSRHTSAPAKWPCRGWMIARPAGSSRWLAAPDGRRSDGTVPWGQIALLSYASTLTLALIWLFWTGRIPRHAAPAPSRPPPPAAAAPASSPPPRTSRLLRCRPRTSPTTGRPIRLGDLEVTPLSIEARPVVLVRTIDPDRPAPRGRLPGPAAPADEPARRIRPSRRSIGPRARAGAAVVRPVYRGLDGAEYPPVPAGDRQRMVDPRPGLPASLEPGEFGRDVHRGRTRLGDRLADEMTWRVRLRIGVYRSDMLGVRFTKAGRPAAPGDRWDDEE